MKQRLSKRVPAKKDWLESPKLVPESKKLHYTPLIPEWVKVWTGIVKSNRSDKEVIHTFDAHCAEFCKDLNARRKKNYFICGRWDCEAEPVIAVYCKKKGLYHGKQKFHFCEKHYKEALENGEVVGCH